VGPLEDVETSTNYLVNEFGRLREATTVPDGTVWILTNNTDGLGETAVNDDLLLRIEEPLTSLPCPTVSFLAASNTLVSYLEQRVLHDVGVHVGSPCLPNLLCYIQVLTVFR